jgi:hypothetical protein
MGGLPSPGLEVVAKQSVVAPDKRHWVQTLSVSGPIHPDSTSIAPLTDKEVQNACFYLLLTEMTLVKPLW